MAKNSSKKTVKETGSAWPNLCLENIKKIPGAVPCTGNQCYDVQNSWQLHQVCHCLPPYQNGCQNNPAPNCCAYSPSSPIPIITNDSVCYCCCGNIGSLAAIAVAKNNSVSADQLKKDDTIYAPADTSLRAWRAVPLAFASLTNTSAGNPQAGIAYKNSKGKTASLIVAAKQLLMLPDRKFKEARKLVPGIDQLVNSEGKAVDIEQVHTGIFTPTMAYLASSAAPANDPAGHLLSLNGIIGGDYALSMGIGSEHLAAGHEQLPIAGTNDYKERYPHLNNR